MLTRLLQFLCAFSRNGGHNWDPVRYTQNLYAGGELISSKNYCKCLDCGYSSLRTENSIK